MGADRHRRDVTISGSGADKHVVVAGAAANLDFLLPAVSYQSGKSFTFQSSGQTWTLTLTPSGHELQTTVKSKAGNKTYSFTHNTFGATVSVDAKGNLKTGNDVLTSRAVMVGANKKSYPCSAWSASTAAVSFSCDDTNLPAAAYPYVIDPYTATITPDSYTCSGSDDGNTCHIGGVYTADYTVNLPAHAIVTAGSVAQHAASGVFPSWQHTWTLATPSGTIVMDAPNGYSYVDYGAAIPVASLPWLQLQGATVHYTFTSYAPGGQDGDDIGGVDVDDASALSITYVVPPTIVSGGGSGNPNSWFNVSFTTQDYGGYQNISGYQYLILNTSAAYTAGCNATLGSSAFAQLNDSGQIFGTFPSYYHYYNNTQGNNVTNTATCSMQNTGATISFAGCFSGCSGTITYSIPVNFSSGGYRNLYLNITNNDGASTGWVNVASVKVGDQPAAPKFNPPAGTYTSAQSVALSTTTSGASIYYTTNGSTPACGTGTAYTTPIAVSSTPNVTTTTTIKAIACVSGWTPATASATYTITGTAAAPTFSAAAGTYQTAQSIALSTLTAGATIRYTTDGSTPTETNGIVYSSAISLWLNSTTTIKAIAYESGWIDSSVSSATFVITGTVATPTITPAGGTYTASQSVTLASGTPGASIYYTIDGSNPATNGIPYSGPITVNHNLTLQAIGRKSTWTDSATASGSYVFTNPTGGGGTGGPGTGTPNADSGNGMDPRRVGVRNFGAYWGAAGEQIDTTSGNLNFSLPLLKILARGGWSIGAMLNYNSQMWRQDAAGDWLMGYDVGYGLGWQLQIGSLTPVWGTGQVDHYIYTDATGAEYSLSINTGGVWTSAEGVFLSYDSNTGRLWATDGSFRQMGCTSANGEQDAGTYYPTFIQDSNGNQIQIQYAPGSGAGGASNTSARIQYIYDPRGPHYHGNDPLVATYSFTYNSDAIPHLTSIAGLPGENYTFVYTNNQALISPFDSTSFGTTTLLHSLTVSDAGIAHTFTYAAGSGEMLSVTTPLGGSLGWTYASCAYAGSISLREVHTRSMNATFSNTWNFTHNDTCSGAQTYHAVNTIADTGAGTTKVYTAGTPVTGFVVPVAYDEANSNGSRNLHKDFGWIQDSYGNVYMNAVTTTVNPGTSAALQSKTVQTLDVYGNLSQSQAYEYGNLTTPARTFNYTYLTDSNYTSRYIRNRLTQATVTSSSGTLYLVGVNYYDIIRPSWNFGYTICGGYQDPGTTPSLHDSTYDTNFQYRGNVTYSATYGGANCYAYQTTGVMYLHRNGAGTTVTTAPSGATNSSLPGVITPNGESNLATTVSYASSWAVTSVAGPNGAGANTTYDGAGRPVSSTSADGAVTTYAYTYAPNTQTATISTTVNNTTTTQWKKTFLDGFGRVTSVQTGHDSTIVTISDTQYAPCACSPLGKLWRTSLPYAPGGTPVWTTYTYDGSGRTLTVTKPDGASVTTYAYFTSVTDPAGNVYTGNFTKVTDPAGKWKISQTDAAGNLVRVLEPNPAGGNSAYLVTSYTYNGANQLTQVIMPRVVNGQTYTQTRTFGWSGTDLAWATNPENGTVTYQYDGAHHVMQRTDAKNQQTVYTYDAYGRLTLVQHYKPDQYGQPVWQSAQDVNYYYDGNPLDNTFSQYAWGRLGAVAFGGMSYQYSYNQAGRVTVQRMTDGPLVDMRASYAWDNQGRMTSMGYPGGGPTYAYQYDNMGRVNGMTENGTAMATASYNAIGQLSQMTYDGFVENRTYNTLMQLTRMTAYGPVMMDMQYNYSATQNNGRITSSVDGVLGETVNYTYDELNRLSTAGASNGAWSQAYSYDGFGNLTGVNGAAVGAADPATNRSVGSDANGLPPSAGAPYLLCVWDVENRMVEQMVGGSSAIRWGYDPYGKRVRKQVLPQPDGQNNWEEYFYGIGGQRLATLQCSQDDSGNNTCGPRDYNLYFAGKLVRSKGVTVVVDRLGSVRGNASGERMSYFPYGQDRTSAGDGREKFGTYFRDWAGQDYADQRYYNQAGAFFSPDPADPGSWNRYAYVGGDPINFLDPHGRMRCADCGDDGDDDDVNDSPGPSPIPPPVKSKRENWYPECNSSGSAQEDSNLAFVANYYADATGLSKESSVDATWLLAWAAQESAYGAAYRTVQNGNFVNETVPKGGVTGGWLLAIPCSNGTSGGYACYSGFTDSLYSALYTQHSTWTYSDQANPSALSVIKAVLAGDPAAGASSVFQAVADAGFDPKGSPSNPGYGNRVQDTVSGIKRRVDCLRINGYI